MPLPGALKPIGQHTQEELMRGTDLPVQLLLSQVKPKLLEDGIAVALDKLLG